MVEDQHADVRVVLFVVPANAVILRFLYAGDRKGVASDKTEQRSRHDNREQDHRKRATVEPPRHDRK